MTSRFKYNKNNKIQKLHTIYEEQNDEDSLCPSLTFKIIFNQNKHIIIPINEYLDYTNKCRLIRIQKMVRDQGECVEHLSHEALSKRKREIVIKIHKKWVDEYFDALTEVEITDRRMFLGSRITYFLNHRIIILNKEVDDLQSQIDFLGLCWLYHYDKNEVKDKGRDIIVHFKTWRRFFCMLVGFEFHDTILKNTNMLNAYRYFDTPFNIYDIHILSEEFGIVLFPLEETLKEFPHCIEYYRSWKTYKF